MRKIYLAASWRHLHHGGVLKVLREAGHQVYNFKWPTDPDGPFGDSKVENHGFHWHDIDPEWKSWTPEEFRDSLEAPLAKDGYARDMRGMQWADTLVMLHPSGRSAHLEAGWMCGYRDAVNEQVKAYIDGNTKAYNPLRAYALVLPGHVEPELMYRMFDGVVCSTDELLKVLG